MRILATLSFFALLSCGGKNTPSEPSVPEISVEEKLKAAQTEETGKMCDRITDCAVFAAKEAMNGEQEIDQAMVDERRIQCKTTYTKTEMSVRQVTALGDCNAAELSCDAFGDCVADGLTAKNP